MEVCEFGGHGASSLWEGYDAPSPLAEVMHWNCTRRSRTMGDMGSQVQS